MNPEAPTNLALLRRELALEKRLADLHKAQALSFFRPHAKQELFFANANFKYRYARTGNRFGKSEMGAAEDVAFALGYRPWYPVGHPLRTLGIPNHATKGLIITTDWDKSTEVFTEREGENLGKLFKYIPADCLGQPTKNHSGAIDRIPVKHISGGWSIIHLDTVKSYKQNPLGQESSVWDWIHIDEPIPEEMWKANARGLVDRKGSAWFTCTPLTEPWIDSAFIPDLESQSKDIAGVISNDVASRWMMTGSMDDNPHNTPDAIALFLSWLTDEEKECRRHGVPTAYSGLVYKEFSWNDHVLRDPPRGWTEWAFPPANFTLRGHIDYHPRKPHAVPFIATSPDGYHYIYNEIWLSCLMEELVGEINLNLRGRQFTCPCLVDPLASTPNRVTDITPMEELQRLGLPVWPATKDPANGILKVKSLLKQRDRLGRPILYFNAACKRTLFEISRGFQWDDDTNKPKKINDDMMEGLYRLALQGLDYIEPTSDSAYTPIPVADFPSNAISFNFQSGRMNEDPTAARRARVDRRYAKGDDTPIYDIA